MADRLIFLDIDGVLNAHAADARGYCGIAPENVRNLNRIIDATDPLIVLSSAWRYMVHCGSMTLEGFEYLLISHHVHCWGALAGLTRKDSGGGDERGAQIEEWLRENGFGRPYVVLDDMDLGISAAGHPFVRTDGKVGLTEADADRAIVILRGGSDG